jgi:hypothetical protein
MARIDRRAAIRPPFQSCTRDGEKGAGARPYHIINTHTRLQGARGGRGGSSRQYRRRDGHDTPVQLSNYVFMSHARQKKERYAVGQHSRPEVADDYFRRVRDQIEMVQYIRGRFGEDRDTVLDMTRKPDYLTRKWRPSALSKGKNKASDDANKCGNKPAPKRATGRARRRSSGP